MGKFDFKPFSTAVLEVLTEVGMQDMRIVDVPVDGAAYELVSSLGITGDLHGYLVIKSDLKSAVQFVRLISEHTGVAVDEQSFGPYHKAAIAEITNQISGRAVMRLSEAGLDCLITPPTIIQGSNIFADFQGCDLRRSLRIQAAFGDFLVLIAVKQQDEGS